MKKSIGYHTRLSSDNTTKVCGGSFGGMVDQETIERLVNVHFEVVIKPSGRAVFVDRQGREVSLYLSVDPDTTTKGKDARVAHSKIKQDEQEKEDQLAEEIEDLLSTMSYEEILKKLK